MAFYTIEKLYHFQCGSEKCGRWWTIGDYTNAAPDTLPTESKVCCPCCSQVQGLVPLADRSENA